MVGKASSVDLEAIKPELQRIMERLDRYELDDIYNCDESGLYLKWMSHWTLDYIKVAGAKAGKADRVSVLFCTNATGSDKRKPFVLNNLYRKIALILGNAPGYLIVADSEVLAQTLNIKIITLPKNSTSNALSLPIHDNDVLAALRNIRLNIHQINQRVTVPMPKEPVNLDAMADDLSPAILSYESVIHWSYYAEPEDLMVFKSIPKPRTFDSICQIEISPPSVYYEPSPFHVMSSGQPMSGDPEFVSYRDIPQQHYGRLSREVGGTTFALERTEEIRDNIVFVRFFE
ncbi:hypothetical protein BGZ50_004965 [Haplosporangium sp. Z 11]|nr:hypothetical protein BGZ50_004965 [Haplosporangium sp. Z 11]